MKKIVLGLMILFAAINANTAMAQDSTAHTNMKVRYYFYPSQNVYYNDATGDYWYYDTPGTGWKIVKTLPSGYTLSNTDREIVYYNGTDVWRKNEMHLKKFKMKNGKTKVKTD